MTLYMKADILDAWVKELRSGKYRQGAGELHHMGYPNSPVETNREPRFCCLGILCEMAVEAGAVSAETDSVSRVMFYGVQRETAYLPIEVIDWAGLRYEGHRQYTHSEIEEPRGFLTQGTRENGYRDSKSLSGMNDSGVPFDEIADTIKAEVVPV